MSLTNFPEMWEKRVEYNLTTEDRAPWLEGVEELTNDVTVLGEGTDTEKNIIYIGTTDFEPDVLINNTTYPLEAQEYSDGTVQITLDKYQPKVVTLSDDQVLGASYPKIDAATRTTTTAITKKKFGKAAHAITPAGNTTNTPILKTTGETVGTRKRCVYEDLVALKGAFDKVVGLDGTEERRLVLCTDHWNDLLLDRKNFGNLLVDYAAGKPAPVIAGFKIYGYSNNPYVTVSTLAKKAYGTVPAVGDQQASFAFVKENIAKKTGKTKQYFLPSVINPRGQSNELGYRHYFVAMPKRNKYIGALVSDVTA